MSNSHTGRDERQAQCGACGAEISYTVSEGSGEAATVACPSCGREVRTEGGDPELEGFGPGVGQSGA